MVNARGAKKRRKCREAVRRALANGKPKTLAQLAMKTGLPVESVRAAIRNHARYFRRANPDTKTRKSVFATYTLAPESEAGPVAPAACQHCGKPKVNRPRGLCWGCYYAPGVRERYGSGSVYARRGVGHTPAARLPARATDAPPGSLEKMRVMHARLLAAESLHHPDDNPEPDAALLLPFVGLHYDGGDDNGLLPQRAERSAAA
jgi:hypothetical protein